MKHMETSVWLKMAIDHINVLKAQALADGIPWSEAINGAYEEEVDGDDLLYSEMLTDGKIYFIIEKGMLVLKNV